MTQGIQVLMRAAFAFSLLSCAAAFGADEPRGFKNARALEIQSLAPADLESKDGWLKVRTPGKLLNPIEKVDGSYTVQLDVGGDGIVNCGIYPEGIDLANRMRTMLDRSIRQIESTHGKIGARVLESADAGAYGAVPYLSLTWLYRVPTPDGARLGGLKQFAMEKGKVGVYCSQDDLGFTNTFATINRAFAETLETQDPGVAPHFVEISTASMSGAKIGVAISTLVRDGNGDMKARQRTAMLIATNDGAVQATDATHFYRVRPDGTIIDAGKNDVSNGELSHELVLKKVEDAWIVEGKLQGKAVKAALPKDSQPGNWIIQARQLRALLAQPNPVGKEHTIGIWLAENPDKLTPTTTTILAKQDEEHFSARGEIGGISANLVLEKSSGMANSIDMKLGPVNVKLERVYLRGGL